VGCIPAQGVVMAEPGEDGALLGIGLAVDEALDVAFCPLWLAGDGEVEVGDVGGLDKRVSTGGAFFGDYDYGAETQSSVCW
jgi:hypothetical protein